MNKAEIEGGIEMYRERGMSYFVSCLERLLKYQEALEEIVDGMCRPCEECSGGCEHIIAKEALKEEDKKNGRNTDNSNNG
jgi:hypothetical protein